jgi:hypothetical protein
MCEFQVMPRGGPQTEKLCFNFIPSYVRWATFAGEDFTDRQCIKRKAADELGTIRRLHLENGWQFSLLSWKSTIAGDD